MSNYVIVHQNELNHYGVKGMKWGVRRQRVRQAYGYGLGRQYTERSDLRKLKKRRAASNMNRSEYKSARKEIINTARKDRGRELVEANQTYAKTIAKGVGKTAAFTAGATAVGALGLALGAGFVAVPGAAALGVMGGTHIINNTRKRARDIRTYNRG